MKTKIGARTHASKGAAKLYFQRMLQSYSPGDAVEDPEDHADLAALIQRHPEAAEKIGAGVALFSVEAMHGGTQCFWVHRVDGSKAHFSYSTAVAAKGRPFRTVYAEAARRAVAADIIRFREAAYAGRETVPCAITGKPLARKQANVDHIPPWTFSAILDAFGISETQAPCDAWLKDSPDGGGAVFASDERARRFVAFHNERARLQIIEWRLNTKLSAWPRGAEEAAG